eukprot:scaffold287_cov119-Isochrysis_galbana.AAC.6
MHANGTVMGVSANTAIPDDGALDVPNENRKGTNDTRMQHPCVPSWHVVGAITEQQATLSHFT